MSESNPIKRQELIEDNVFSNATKSANELKDVLSDLVVGFEGIIKVNNEFLKLNKDPKSAKEIRDISKAIVEQEKARKALFMAEQQAERLKQQELKTEKEAINTLKAKQAELKRQQKELENLNSEYKKGVQRLSELKKAMKEMAFAGKEGTEEFKKLNKEFTDLDGRVRKAESTVGEFQRNVGNYKSGFDGLGNSINQLTREFPAFANSVQTGFMALSNNIPMFFDQISRTRKEIEAMRAEGHKVPGLLSQLTTSFFSWGTALSLGVTLLTVYGKEIGNLIQNLFKAEGATISLMNATKDHHEVMRDYYVRKRDLVFQDAVNSKRLTEEEVARLKTSSDLRLAIAKEEKSFSEARSKVAKELGVDLKNETSAIVKFFKDLVADPMSQKAYDSKKVEKFTEEESKLLEQLAERKKLLEELYQLELKAELFSIQERENKKKHTKELTDQDKRVLDEMQQLDKKRMDDKEKMQKWEEDLFNERQKWGDDTVWWDKENGITLDEHNQTLKDIESAREKARQDKIKDVEQQIQFAQQVTNFLIQELQRQEQIRQRYLDREINQRKTTIDRQTQLAAAGFENTLAFEEMYLSKKEQQRRDSEKRIAREQEAIQLAQTYLNAYNAELKQPNANPSSAAAKALLNVLTAKGISKVIATFYEGTEDTGVVGQPLDNNGGRLALLHNNERVVTKKQNKLIGDLSNNELATIANLYNTGDLVEKGKVVGIAEYVKLNYLLNEQVKTNKLLEEIASKPSQHVEFKEVHKRMDVIETIYKRGGKDIIEHRGKTRI
jgi:hypothetical protein